MEIHKRHSGRGKLDLDQLDAKFAGPAAVRDDQLINDFLASEDIPVDPQLPENWDNTDNNQRPACHRLLWGKPYIVTERETREEHKAQWFEWWPEGVRYNVRCLDGGAWDRSTNHGFYKTLDEAMAAAKALL